MIFSAYPIYLAASRGDAFAFAKSQGFWNRHFSHAGPFGGLWDGLRAGWAGVEPAWRYEVPAELERWPRYHVRVRFARAVPGPLAVGAGRYRGFGLFAADGG